MRAVEHNAVFTQMANALREEEKRIFESMISAVKAGKQETLNEKCHEVIALRNLEAKLRRNLNEALDE